MPFFRIFQHLLPRSRVWSLVVDRTLRKFFQGLANGVPTHARAYIDNVWEQIDPDTTDEIAEWESAFGIIANSTDSEVVRRARLDARWQATGGQGLDYIEGVLQAAGFNVYLHECWLTSDASEQATNVNFVTDTDWTKGTNWTITPVSPPETPIGAGVAAGATAAQYLEQDALSASVKYRISYTVADYVSGSVTVYAGSVAGTARTANGRYTEELTADGAALRFGGSAGGFNGSIQHVAVRIVREPRDPRDYVGEIHVGTTRCSAFPTQPRCRPFEWEGGDPADQWRCNNWLANDPGYIVNIDLTRRAPPAVPEDEAYWPYFLYVGPEVLTTEDCATVPVSRRVEFKRLLMQLCPTQHWVVLMVDYTGIDVFDDMFSIEFE